MYTYSVNSIASHNNNFIQGEAFLAEIDLPNVWTFQVSVHGKANYSHKLTDTLR